MYEEYMLEDEDPEEVEGAPVTLRSLARVLVLMAVGASLIVIGFARLGRSGLAGFLDTSRENLGYEITLIVGAVISAAAFLLFLAKLKK